MSIMSCYSDERSIENELGGKWEKFYEYTFDTSHGEGFEFPHDIDENESPLNLNGIMIVITRLPNYASLTNLTSLYINGVHIIDRSIPTQNEFICKVKICNGVLEGYIVTPTGASGQTTIMSTPILTTKINSIKSFSFAGNNFSVNTKIEFYVLRGV